MSGSKVHLHGIGADVDGNGRHAKAFALYNNNVAAIYARKTYGTCLFKVLALAVENSGYVASAGVCIRKSDLQIGSFSCGSRWR